MPESAVLVGLVPVSKLNCFGLSEWCGEAVVELANHSFESVTVFCTAAVEVVEGILVEPMLLLLLPPTPAPLSVNAVFTPLALTCPRAIAIGLGDESGDEDVRDDIYS